MRILPISDIHVEFHPDAGKRFVESLPSSGVDVCVVAGDLGDSGTFDEALRRLGDRFPQVVYIHGNHECYGSTIPKTHAAIRKLVRKIDNVHFLHNEVIKIREQRFVGTTMWFAPHPRVPQLSRIMNDYEMIIGFVRRVGFENGHATAFLRNEVRRGDIVLTHHAPCWRSIDPRWRRSPLMRLCYVCDQNELIHHRQPALWVHGHIHRSWDYDLWGTRVVCNPHGYFNDEMNREFRPNKIVEV